jgi:signal transduction histidine kinase
VAGHWRIRHKLLLGLALVVVVMAVLLAGTCEGLWAYRSSMNSVESKINELYSAQQFKEKIIQLARVNPLSNPKTQREELNNCIEEAEQGLINYQAAFQDTCDRGRTPRKEQFWIQDQIQGLQGKLGGLRVLIGDLSQGAEMVPSDGGWRPLRRDPKVDNDINQLMWEAAELEKKIYEQLYEIKTEARGQYTFSFWMVGATSLLSVLLMAGLLRFFYRWVFDPVRQLMEGVPRVAQGDFEKTIEVKSGDEMEDLAAAFNDMTGRLRDMYRDLARQVNERSRQLVRSERLASVGFLAAGVAHEINNPLASIAFCSEALEGRLTEVLVPGNRRTARSPDAEIVFKYLKMIQQEAFRCKEITQRLLEFSRCGEFRREPTDLGELIQSVLDVTQHLQIHKGKTILFDPVGRVTAWVNAQEIKSVVLNLVVNALDSMDEGGTLTVSLRGHNKQAELIFHDTGCGMTAEVLENIFEPFFTHSRSGKGTGLGLTISHRIITGHGGEIEASSPGPNQGSQFTVRLPLQATGDQGGTGDPEPDMGPPEALFRRRQAA